MPSCSIKWCGKCSTNSSYVKDGVTFHRFPNDDIQKKEIWIRATRREDFFPTKTSVICSRHFTPDCFENLKNNRRRLHKSAMPTLYLPILDEVSGGSKSKEKENEIKLFCPKCKTEVSHTAEGIQADQTKIIVAKVYNYLEQEYEELKKTFEGIDQTPLSKIRQRTALATGVSETMVEEILQEEARRHEELHQETLLEESRARKRPRQTESLMEEGSSDENEADDEDKNEDEDIADDDDQIETLVIKEEPIEPYNEESEAYVELPAVKQEPGEFGDNQEVAQPVSVCLKTEPQDEEEATTEEKRKELKRKKTNARQRAYYHRQKDLKISAGIIKKTVPKSNAERQRKFRQRNAEKSYMDISTETTAVQLASKSKKRRTTKRNTDVPPAATISPATSVLPGTSTPGSSAIPGTSAPPERRLILLEDGEVKMEQIEIGEEGFS